MPQQLRPDRVGQHRTTFDKNRKKILATQNVCGICGKIVDKTLKRPDPFAPEVDHIIPVSKGGHPSSLDNLQLVHGCCNKAKGDKIHPDAPTVTNNDLRWSMDWTTYKP